MAPSRPPKDATWIGAWPGLAKNAANSNRCTYSLFTGRSAQLEGDSSKASPTHPLTIKSGEAAEHELWYGVGCGNNNELK